MDSKMDSEIQVKECFVASSRRSSKVPNARDGQGNHIVVSMREPGRKPTVYEVYMPALVARTTDDGQPVLDEQQQPIVDVVPFPAPGTTFVNATFVRAKRKSDTDPAKLDEIAPREFQEADGTTSVAHAVNLKAVEAVLKPRGASGMIAVKAFAAAV